jgi:hypothetical protein
LGRESLVSSTNSTKSGSGWPKWPWLESLVSNKSGKTVGCRGQHQQHQERIWLAKMAMAGKPGDQLLLLSALWPREPYHVAADELYIFSRKWWTRNV